MVQLVVGSVVVVVVDSPSLDIGQRDRCGLDRHNVASRPSHHSSRSL